MKNQSRTAAQTASIGNQDMMTFMPSPGGGGGGVEGSISASASQHQALASAPAPTAMLDPTACGDVMGNNNTGGMVPNPLHGNSSFDRGESMDDEAFNASLDALLKESSGDDYGGEISMDGMDATSSSGNSLAEAVSGAKHASSGGGSVGGGGGRKRKKCGWGALITEMSSLTNSSSDLYHGEQQQQQQPTSAATAAVAALHHQHQQAVAGQQQRPAQPAAAALLNYSARGIVQLPPMFASQPISVATTGTPGTTAMLGNPTLMGTNIFSGGAQQVAALGHPQAAATTQAAQQAAAAAAQQLPFQVAAMALPQPQHAQLQSSIQAASSVGGVGNTNTSSATASLMSHMAGMHHAPNSTNAQQQQQQELFPAFQLNAAASNNPWDASAAAATATALRFSSQQPQQVQAALASAAAAVGVTSRSSQQQAPRVVSATPIPQAVSSGVTPAAARAVSVARSSAAASSKTTAATKTPTSSTTTSSSSIVANTNHHRGRKRTLPTVGNFTLAVSEDESDQKRRRSERNAREQERSHKITERIAELRTVLAEAGVHFKPDRYNTLVSVTNYIKILQTRSQSLDEEHQKLLDTISGADELVKSNHAGMEVGIGSNNNSPGGMISTVQTHCDMENTPSSNLSSSSNSNNDEEFLEFVQGIDYKSIFSSCGVALAIASVDGRFVDCNDEFLRITDYTRTELLGEEPRLPRNSMLPHPQAEGGGVQHQVVTVSTLTSANSSALTTAAAVAAAKSPDLHTSGKPKPMSSNTHDHPPREITMRKQHHLSLFNLLGGEDMEAVYAAMSRMLRAPEPSTASASCSRNFNLSSSTGKDDSGGASSSSSDSFVKSDLTRSTEESGSSGNEVSNPSSSSGVMGGVPGGEVPTSEDHWTGPVNHTRRKNRMVSLFIYVDAVSC